MSSVFKSVEFTDALAKLRLSYSDNEKDYWMRAEFSGGFIEEFATYLGNYIDSITSDPERWAEKAPYSSENKNLDTFLQFATKPKDIDSALMLFLFLYRCTIEMQLYNDFGVHNSETVESTHHQVSNSLIAKMLEEDKNYYEKFMYEKFEVPLRILSKKDWRIVSNELREVDSKLSSMNDRLDNWDSSFSEKEKKVDALKKELEKHKDSFNFVGLASGFKGLLNTKLWEARRLTLALGLIGIAAIIPLAIKAGLVPETLSAFLNISSMPIASTTQTEGGLTSLTAFLPLLSLEIILIYFFRVVLQQINDVKTQIIQIRLRYQLCTFIQDYAKYVTELKENQVTLDKFETIIFSGIVSKSDTIPSTFDGIEQLGKLFKELKKTT